MSFQLPKLTSPGSITDMSRTGLIPAHTVPCHGMAQHISTVTSAFLVYEDPRSSRRFIREPRRSPDVYKRQV
ncbi:hypothetical protein HOY80DRAFT_1007764 [Tuber brumale]|nr:hypothetical protein HOY80DRAFT_1007764 [Tuber brumale]